MPCAFLRWVCNITVLVGEDERIRQRTCSPNFRWAAFIVLPPQCEPEADPISSPCLSQQRSGPAGDPSTLLGSLCSPKPQVGRVQVAGSQNCCCLCHVVSQLGAHRSHAQWEGMETLHRHQDNSLTTPKTCQLQEEVNLNEKLQQKRNRRPLEK